MLGRSRERDRLRRAFLTTFEPWTLSFLAEHFGSTKTTLFVTDAAIDDYECEKCDRQLRVVGGRVWTCAECGYDLCSQCAGEGVVNQCPNGHVLTEQYPGLFAIEEGARVHNAEFDEETMCYHAEVVFDESAPHRFGDGGQLRVVVPRRPSTFCVHPKMMVLNFGSHVWIVVSSFNMSESQWAKAGDVFWWADLPLNQTPSPHLSRIGRDPNMHAPLYEFLCSIGAQDTASLIDCVDWRLLHCDGLHAIVSLPGEHQDKRFGLRRLGEVLRTLPKFPRAQSPVLMQVWSAGGSNVRWYKNFVSVLTQEPRDNSDGPLSPQDVRFVVQTPGKGHYKSFDDRMVTRGCLWEDQNHPFYHGSNIESGSSVSWGWHSKVMYRMYPRGVCRNRNCNRVHGWAYVGSHNCSAASWGSFGRGTISIRNFELGLVVTSLPALRHGSQCGRCLKEAVPIPWSSTAALIPYRPTPDFVRGSFGGDVKTYYGTVVSTPAVARDQIAVRATILGDDGTDADDDSTKSDFHDEIDNGSEGDDGKEAETPDKLFIIKRYQDCWPPPLGTTVVFDVSRRFGIVHVY